MKKRKANIGDLVHFLTADPKIQNDKMDNVADAIHANLIGVEDQQGESERLNKPAEANLPGVSTRSLPSQPQQHNFHSSGSRSNLIPEGTNLHIMDTQIEKIYTELSSLAVNNYPNAVAGLFRMFVEISCKYYVEKHKLGSRKLPQTLVNLVKIVSDDLITSGHLTESAARPMIAVTTDRDHLFGITTLHHYMHSLHQRAVPGDLIRHWDNIEPFMEAMWRKE